jgi:hypothetical protein
MWDKDFNEEISQAELYRQNYEDALDEIRNLKFKIAELETENNLLIQDINRAECFFLSRED